MHEIIEARMTDKIRSELRDARRNPDPAAAAAAEELIMAPAYVRAPVEALDFALETVDPRGAEETWRDMIRLQDSGAYPAAFASIRIPVLMLHGDFDPHPGDLIRESLRRHIPHLEYRPLAECGHYPWLERTAAEPFYRAIGDWLAKTPP